MKAIIYKSTGSWYVAKTEEGKIVQARIKGKFKIDGFTSTNPIAVGDQVEIEMENDLEQTVMITGIADRRNYINRQSPATSTVLPTSEPVPWIISARACMGLPNRGKLTLVNFICGANNRC